MSRKEQRNPDFEFLMDDEGRDVFGYGEEKAPGAETPLEEPGYPDSEDDDYSEDESYDEFEEEEEEANAEPDPAVETAPESAPQSLSDAVGAPPRTGFGSNLPLLLGLCLTLAGIGLGAAGTLNMLPKEILAQLANLGLQPGLMFMTGVILSGIGLGLRRSAQNSIQQFASKLSEEIDYLRSEVQAVTEQSNAARAAALAQSVEGMQGMMSKQESMLGNLTKATRMFNKPLMDLASNVHDLDRKQEEVRRNVLAIEKAQSEDIASSERKFEGLVEQLHKHTVNVQHTVTEALRDEGKRILSCVEKVLETNKLFAEESTKRFQSLEDGMLDVLSEHSNTTTERFTEFSSHVEHIEKQTKELLERGAPELDLSELGAISGKLLELQATLQNFAALEKQLTTVQQSIQELAAKPAPEPVKLDGLAQIDRNIAQVQRAVQELAQRPVPQAVATAAPAASRAASTPAPAAAPAAARPSAGGGADPLPAPISGTSESQTGGKVLSAIEKLKQLRGS